MAKKSKLITEPPSKEEAQAFLGEYAQASVEKRRLEALKDKEINTIREKYQQRLDEQDARMAKAFDQIEAWASANRDSEFKGRQSQEWAFGTVGYLKHPPKVALRKGFTWAAVIEMLKDRGLDRYIRRTESVEVAKEVVLSDREDEAAVAALQPCGIELKQDEQFYIKAKEDTA